MNKQITSNNKIHLEVQKTLNSLIIKYNFFFGRLYFTSNDGSQNTFVYLLILDTSEYLIYQKTKLQSMFLVVNQGGYLILNLGHKVLSHIP